MVTSKENKKYSHWGKKKYDPKERHERFEKSKNRCPICGGLKSPGAKTCKKCIYVKKDHWLKGKKLPDWWKNRITNKFKAGEEHPNWKGGITSKNKLLRVSDDFKKWRKAVFERDNYTCVWCGKKGGELHPDHIKKLSKFPELAYDVSNGRTLCKECHQKRHGVKNLTTNRPQELICSNCGKKYKPKSRSVWRSGYKNHFCSKKCLSSYRSRNWKNQFGSSKQ